MSAYLPTVAIVGGGFTGAAVAWHLASLGAGARIVVFEPRALLGAGLAYGGDDPSHRINVPASRMSLLPDDEAHFSRWLTASGALAADPEARQGDDVYARRRDFGRYVDANLRALLRSGAVEHVQERVTGLIREGTVWRLATAEGRRLTAEIVILATTHPKPAIPSELAALAEDSRLIADGLADDALSRVEAGDRLLIVGSGLTAADLVASLAARGHSGRIVMVSRRGLRSRGHGEGSASPRGDFTSRPAREASKLLARVHAEIRSAERAGGSWREVLDSLRNNGSDIWRALTPAARRRVVRHLRPYWDVHRFRIAPQVDAVITGKLADGSLELRRARLGAARDSLSGIEVEFHDSARTPASREIFDRVLIATGPAHRAILDQQPALRELAAAGWIRLDGVGLGLETSPEGRAVGADGRTEPTLFIAGPLARGTFGELMGLPQVAAYARFIAGQTLSALAPTKLTREVRGLREDSGKTSTTSSLMLTK